MSITPVLEPSIRDALEQLIEVARSDTGQARRCANFLLAWWNAGDLGGFDLTDLWNVDDELGGAMVLIFGYVARHQVYPAELGYRADFVDLVHRWRPQVLTTAEDEEGR